MCFVASTEKYIVGVSFILLDCRVLDLILFAMIVVVFVRHKG